VKRLVVALTAVASLIAIAVAQGVVVQDFNFRIKDVKTWGGYTVVFTSSSYEPNGGIPDELTENYLRLPKGAVVPKLFRNKRFYCDAEKLKEQVRVDKGSRPFTPVINNLLKGKKTPPKNAKNLIDVCRYARIGTGTGEGLVISLAKYEPRPVPADLMLFWTKPAPGAVAAFAIIAIPDQTSQVIKDNPNWGEIFPVFKANFYSDKTSDQLYDYKLVLPTGRFNGLRIAVTEVHVTTTGMTYVKKTKKCVKKRHGKCVKSKTATKRTFWFTEPTCPDNGKLSFEAFYGYDTAPDQLKTKEIPCPPRFRK